LICRISNKGEGEGGGDERTRVTKKNSFFGRGVLREPMMPGEQVGTSKEEAALWRAHRKREEKPSQRTSRMFRGRTLRENREGWP